jgi:hypothetical protein
MGGEARERWSAFGAVESPVVCPGWVARPTGSGSCVPVPPTGCREWRERCGSEGFEGWDGRR